MEEIEISPINVERWKVFYYGNHIGEIYLSNGTEWFSYRGYDCYGPFEDREDAIGVLKNLYR